MTEVTFNNTDWKIYTGKLEPHDGLKYLPEAPPWRPFGKDAELITPETSQDIDADLDYALARSFCASNEMVDAVNTALYLRRPLLITGKPGIGKSSLIRAVARELQLGQVLRWPITSKSTVKDGLYLYDALGRLDKHNRTGQSSEDNDIGKFIELGPLGTALLPTPWPRALLIDEIDKSDLDFPNDLLNIFEEGEYTIPEIARAKAHGAEKTITVRTWRNRGDEQIPGDGHVRCTHFPFVVMTSNRFREFEPAFVRRCIRITIDEPSKEMLGAIVRNHFDVATEKSAAELIDKFLAKRSTTELATDQLLNAIYLIFKSDKQFAEDEKQELIDKLLKPISGSDATA